MRGWMFLLLMGPVSAHQQPATRVLLDSTAAQVSMTLCVPLSELELAFAHEVTERPLAGWAPAFRTYLLDHVRVDGWTVEVVDVTLQAPEVVAKLTLKPSGGAGPRELRLHYDVVLHQVVTHKVLVSVRSDWGPKRVDAGVIAVNVETGRVEPFVVRLGEGGWWSGFRDMVTLGMEHIQEGTDHVLFLLALLLAAPLSRNGREWGGFGGVGYGMRRLIGISAAFTAGHSATLLVGALGWLRLPRQPVEVLIAVSILISAVHAVRPLFPEREAQMAVGFGLVHGLAFATVLGDLHLDAGRMALSILGFNMGIELMQLFVIAVTAPWLIVLSRTPAYRWVRLGGALLAGVAAVGWIVNRVSGEPNAVERLMEMAAAFAPLGVLGLVLLAVPAHFHTMLRQGER